MRVLTVGNMYPPHHLGGYELTWRTAVRHIRAAGHAVRVLTTDHRQPGVSEAAEAADDDVHRELRWYWRDHRFPRMSPLARLSLERHNAAVMDGHLADFRPDVVGWWAMGGMSLSLVERVRRAGLPAVGVVGDEWMAYGPRVDGWMRMWLSRLAPGAAVERATGIPTSVDLGAAGRWLCNSEMTRARSAAAGVAPECLAVAHPGVDRELFTPSGDPGRRWVGRLLYVGRIDPRKGIATAIEALPALPEDAVLSVLGSGDERHLGALRHRAAALGVSDRVTFDEVPRSELPRRYAAADALVFPVEWREPWGIVPLEAMAMGLPVVATGTGGSGEYLRHEDNCLLFEPGDARALAGALQRLAEDGELRASLRSAGLRAAASFDEDTYNAAILEALVEAARTHAGRSHTRARSYHA